MMTLKEIGNDILKMLETESKNLNLENNIFKLEKIKKNKFLLSRTDSKTKIEIHLSRKKIAS